jgi:hypothetical protein
MTFDGKFRQVLERAQMRLRRVDEDPGSREYAEAGKPEIVLRVAARLSK